MHGRDDAVIAKASAFKRKVAVGLGELARDGDQRTGVIERRAVKRREVAKQLACASGLRARKRGDGVERVEQKMRVDLRLQGAKLGARRQLVLALQLMRGQLGRDQLRKTRHQSVLRAIDRVRAAEIELERSH